MRGEARGSSVAGWAAARAAVGADEQARHAARHADLYSGQARPSAAGPEIVAPIYSQPLIELALRIPADVLFTNG